MKNMKKNVSVALASVCVLAGLFMVLVFSACPTPGAVKPSGNTYSISKGATPANGNFSITPTAAAAGATITLTVYPVSGYEFFRWNIEGINPAQDTANPDKYTFTMPSRNVEVYAEFKLIGSSSSAAYLLYSNGALFPDGGIDPETGFQVWETPDPDTGDLLQFVETAAEHSGPFGHSTVLQIGPAMGLYGGGIAMNTALGSGVNLNEVDALSFWAMSPDGFTIANAGFGTDDLYDELYTIQYAGENNRGIVVGTTWKNIIIPLPTQQNVSISQAFAMWALKANEGKTLYLDEIAFIEADKSLKEIVLRSLTIFPATKTPLSRRLPPA